MDRRSFLKLAGLIPATALFGCKGTDQEKSQDANKRWRLRNLIPLQ